jgi:ribosomal protein L37AE/L43A
MNFVLTMVGNMKKIKLFNPINVVGCPKCGQRTFKKIVNSDNSFYWKCTHCLYETQVNKKK